MGKKVYILAQNLELGGLEKAVISLANALAENKIDVILLVVLKSNQIIKISSDVKLQYLTNIRCNNREVKIQRYLRKLIELYAIKKAIKNITSGTIISSRNEYTTILSKYGHKDVKKIAQLHNEYTRKMEYDFVNNYGFIDVFQQLTDEFRDEISEKMKIKNSYTKNITIPNFVDYREKNLLNKENFIIAVGGFNPVKGFDRLIEIWSKIEKKYPLWKLIIVGNGKEFNSIQELIFAKNMVDRVVLPGFLSNSEVFEYMGKSKIYAMTSHSEAFPFVLIEAMQCSLCPIAFDVRVGPRAMIKNEFNGFLIENGNLDEYADKLEILIQNESLRSSMAENAYNKSLDFVKENVIKQWLKII